MRTILPAPWHIEDKMPTHLEVTELMIKRLEEKGLGGPLLKGLKAQRAELKRSASRSKQTQSDSAPKSQRLSVGLRAGPNPDKEQPPT
jgi:hypothetical protein